MKKKMKISWKAIWNYKCPRCKEGDMYKKPFEFSKPLNMHRRCPNCNLDFEPEPGFYFGALMISYAVSSWMLLIPALTLVFYFDWSVNGAMLFTLAFAAISYLKVLRISRAIYLHFSMRYDKSLENSQNSASNYDKSLF